MSETVVEYLIIRYNIEKRKRSHDLSLVDFIVYLH